jgi:hypothetical protein
LTRAIGVRGQTMRIASPISATMIAPTCTLSKAVAIAENVVSPVVRSA